MSIACHQQTGWPCAPQEVHSFTIACHQQTGWSYAAKQVHSIKDLASASLPKGASHLMGATSRSLLSLLIRPSRLCPGPCPAGCTWLSCALGGTAHSGKRPRCEIRHCPHDHRRAERLHPKHTHARQALLLFNTKHCRRSDSQPSPLLPRLWHDLVRNGQLALADMRAIIKIAHY